MKTLLLVVCLFVAGSVAANDSCWSGFAAITEKSDGRVPVGVVPSEGFATDLYGSVSCGKWNFSGWMTLETENDFAVNEIDGWVRHDIWERGPLKVRVGGATYNFPGGTDHYLSELDLFYTGFIDASLEIDYDWTDPGSSYTGTVWKTFDVGKTRYASFSFTPSVMGACMKGFFGMTGCVTNVSYQGKLSASWGKQMEWGADLSVARHEGGGYRVGGRDLTFSDGWGVKLALGKFFGG